MKSRAAKKMVKKTSAPVKLNSKKSAAPKKMAASKGSDIIDLILADHKPLKKLIKVMKDSERGISERRAAFKEFAPLLITHAKPEEQVLYVQMKDDEEMRIEGLEGDVEHGLADQLIDEAKRTNDEGMWSARVKVLAELVEHHIEEEEGEMLPDFRKHTGREERVQLGEVYLNAKANVKDNGDEIEPSFKPLKGDQISVY